MRHQSRANIAPNLLAAAVLVIAAVWFLVANMNGAIDCQNHGGQWVKNWNGFHVCAGATK